jgi:hypothetical protein
MANETDLHSLIPLTEFKAILGIDDREDACYPQGSLSNFVLIAATYTIEEYCKRHLLKKKCLEYLDFFGDYIFPLREYPVRKILTLYRTHPLKKPEFIKPYSYHTIPDGNNFEDSDLWSAPYCLSVSPGLKMVRGMSVIKVHYCPGYSFWFSVTV